MAAWLLPLAIQPASIKTPYTHTPTQNRTQSSLVSGRHFSLALANDFGHMLGPAFPPPTPPFSRPKQVAKLG